MSHFVALIIYITVDKFTFRLYYAELLAKWGVAVGIIYVLLKKTDLSQHLLWAFISLMFKVMQYMPRSWLKYLNS